MHARWRVGVSYAAIFLHYTPNTSSHGWKVLPSAGSAGDASYCSNSLAHHSIDHIGSHVALWGDALIVPRAEVKPCLHVTRLLPHAFQSVLTFLGRSQPIS